jgi:hypothetical protein
MNNKMKEFVYKGLMWSFGILWVLVAIISMYHTWLFFAVGNPAWLAGIMSVAFETGLALSLFSVLVTENNKIVIPWALMVLLTIVQICGNVFSVYKYMIEGRTATTAYQYINGSFLHWFTEDMPQNDILSIIAIMLGAILPIVALFMTDMVANNWKLKNKESENDTIDKSEETTKSEETIEPVDASTEVMLDGSTISAASIGKGPHIINMNNEELPEASNIYKAAAPKDSSTSREDIIDIEPINTETKDSNVIPIVEAHADDVIK